MIKLSTKNLNFAIGEADETVTTLGGFRICAFVDSENYNFIQEASSKYGLDETIFIYGWVSVQKIGLNALKITVIENATDKDRNIKIQLNNGNYYDYITVTQN